MVDCKLLFSCMSIDEGKHSYYDLILYYLYRKRFMQSIITYSVNLL